MSLQSQFDYLFTRIERLNPIKPSPSPLPLPSSGNAAASTAPVGTLTNGTTTTTNTTTTTTTATSPPGGDNNSFFSSNNIIFSQLKSSTNINKQSQNQNHSHGGNKHKNRNNNNSNNNNSNISIQSASDELDEIALINDVIQLYHSQQQQAQQLPNSLQQQLVYKDYYIKLILKMCQHVSSDGVALKYFQMTILLAQNNQLSLSEHSNELAPLLQLFLKYIQLNSPPSSTSSSSNNNNNNNTGNANKHPTAVTTASASSTFQSHQYSTVRTEALKAFSIVLYNNGPSIPSKFHQPLFDSLLLLATLQPTANNPSPLSINQETKRLATISIGNLCVQGSKLSKFYPLLFDKLYANLEKLVVQLSSDHYIMKFTCSTLRSLQIILTQCKGVYDNKASSLFAILKRLMFFGTNINPNAVLPSQLHAVEPYKFREHVSDFSDGISSSDSDVDERYSFAKVRFSTLSLLSTLCKSSSRLFFGYWTSFLPTQLSMPSLFTTALSDQDYRVRFTAIQVLTTIFDGCKDLLVAIPKDPSTPSSYTSFSQILTAMIQESHRGLQLLIDQEKSSNLLVPAIKCLTVLIQNAPYERLPAGLLTQLIKLVSPFLNNASTDTQLASLSAIIAILSTEPPTPDELHEFLSTSDIVERIIQFGANAANSDHMRIEATQCILALTKHNFQILCKHHESIYTTLFGLLTAPALDSTLRIQSSKTIEEISKSIHESQKANISFDTNVEKRIWDLFFKSITGLIEDPLPQIRSSICNCLSNLTSNVFANLPIQLQLHSVTVILGLMSDESSLVRASSCRTIGMFVRLETLADDTTFLSKAASCLYKSMCDNNINIRIRACWSLANLCDHLISIRKDEVFNDIPTLILSKVVEVLLLASYDNPKVRSNAVRALGNFARFAPHELLYNTTPVDIQDIFETIQQNQQLQSNNGDMSKANSQPMIPLSAITSSLSPATSSSTSTSNTSEQNTLALYQKNMMDRYVKNHHKSLIDRIIDSLVINAAEPSTSFNFVKVKWNSCYALGNLFYNSDIQFDPTPKWLHQIYETLVYLVQDCKNYKIKINASASLATPTHNRLQYGEDYQTILETIINSLSNVNTLIDHSEYQYKDILERQLGVSLIHLMGEMTYDEIETYQTLLLTHSDIIYETFEKLNPFDQVGKKQDRPTAMEYNQGMATIKQFIDHFSNNDTQFESDCQLKLSNLKKLFEELKL